MRGSSPRMTGWRIVLTSAYDPNPLPKWAKWGEGSTEQVATGVHQHTETRLSLHQPIRHA